MNSLLKLTQMTLLTSICSQQENRGKSVALSNIPELGRGGGEAAAISSGFRFTVVTWEDDSQTRGHASGLKISPQHFLQLAAGKQLKQIKNVLCRLSTSTVCDRLHGWLTRWPKGLLSCYSTKCELLLYRFPKTLVTMQNTLESLKQAEEKRRGIL